MSKQPLAARSRPHCLDDIVGQDHLLGPGSPLRGLATSTAAVSVILWGPPGTGKTSMAQAIAAETSQEFVELSATSAGVAEVRKVLAAAERRRDEDGARTLLFIDEIHRFSKAQQDVLLPAVESGTVSLIGATTENPSFSVNPALVSRSLLLVLQPLGTPEIAEVIRRAVGDPRGLDDQITLDQHAVELIARLSSGDARQALNRLETCFDTAVATGSTEITPQIVEQVAGTALQRYDRDGDQHYDVISAFIKSMRGSDPDATLHWLARMIEAGEDPRFIARRLIVHASEDVGLADPSVLGTAIAAAQAVQFVGLPEARLALAQAALAIATAPKSNAVLQGIDEALADVRAGRTGAVPNHLRDAHYPGAKALGHGAGYRYPHAYLHGLVAQEYLPMGLEDRTYYYPTRNGFEQALAGRLSAIAAVTQEGPS